MWDKKFSLAFLEVVKKCIKKWVFGRFLASLQMQFSQYIWMYGDKFQFNLLFSVNNAVL